MATNNFDPTQYGATLSTPTPSPSSGGFNPAQYGASPEDNAMNQVQGMLDTNPQQGNWLSKIGNALSSNEQSVAQGITSAYGAKQISPAVQKQTQDTLNQLYSKARSYSSGDPRRTRILQIAQQISGTMGGIAGEQLANIPSTEKVAGGIAGTTLDLLAGGTLPAGLGATEGAVQAADKGGILKGALAGAKEAAKVGGALGAGYGVAGGMQEDKSLGGVLGSGVTGALTGAAIGGGIGGVTGGISGGIQTAAERATAREASATQKSIQTAIDAVNPDLTGKKLIPEYKAGFGQNATEATYLKGQALEANKKITDLGTSLQDVLKSKNPLTNLKALGPAMQDAETKLTGLLEADKTPFIKQSAVDVLNELKGPREFRIGEPGKAFRNVVNFGKEMINKTTPDMKGLREAVTAFDQQARTQFPNAYNPAGYIDTKTAAGSAIKSVRDEIRNYMYKTAEKSPELQAAIKRESDLLKARDLIAPKAAASHGMTKVQAALQAHPKLTKFVKGGLMLGGTERLLHGLGLPL